MTENRSCPHAKWLGCRLPESECPLSDWGFLGAMDYYLTSLPGIGGTPTGIPKSYSYDNLRLEIAVSLEPLDMIVGWDKTMYDYLNTGKVDMTRDLCVALRNSQYQWWLRASPPGYPWLGRVAKITIGG